ncbi:Universal stress A-like protein [Nymphaea thermarum]|nr:Universal stress A-like protein [Nymphaea thermarum]
MEFGKAARKIMVALHDNEESLYALEWALNHLIDPVIGCNSSKLVLIYAAPEAMASTPLTGKEIAFSSHVVGVLKRNQKRMAEKVMEQATKLCEKHGVAYESKMFVGEPNIVICEMSKKLRVDLLVVESHEGGWFKRFFSANNIGRYCVDHAKCPVMIY